MKTTLIIEIETPDDFTVVPESVEEYYGPTDGKVFAKEWHNNLVDCIKQKSTLETDEYMESLSEFYDEDGLFPDYVIKVKQLKDDE